MPNWINLLLLLSAPLFSAKCTASRLPYLKVPSCTDGKGSIQYNRSVPSGKKDFPRTHVDMCYTDTAIQITFTALDEVNFYYNASQTTNDPIYNYEVMEAFIYRGTNDPQQYLEFEVNPNNVTWQAFIYNPSKVRAQGAPFDQCMLKTPLVDGLVASTRLDRDAKTWVSDASIPLGLFNIDEGLAKGTEWRMNFLRTVVSPATFPNQTLGAWNPPDEANFHITPLFGNVYFV
ncbi:hypothetical protein GGR50DRAFT_503312 [Xylaria sp. CBS 124048]|nr:hypothetical protein GGR50DRAFT_503312 [Xylaria sp. CBS 124048]